MLKAQITLLEGKEANPFIPDETDRQDACPEILILDEDIADDEEIDITDWLLYLYYNF